MNEKLQLIVGQKVCVFKPIGPGTTRIVILGELNSKGENYSVMPLMAACGLSFYPSDVNNIDKVTSGINIFLN